MRVPLCLPVLLSVVVVVAVAKMYVLFIRMLPKYQVKAQALYYKLSLSFICNEIFLNFI